jgi:hypothetical protein
VSTDPRQDGSAIHGGDAGETSARTRHLPAKLPELVPQPHGGAIYRGGVPGHTGSGGRPPDEFKAAMQRLASREETIAMLTHILADPQHPHFMRALEFCAERGFGKVPAPVEVELRKLLVLDV